MKFMCVYRLRFTDGGDDEFGVLHQGDEDSCKRVMAMIPAISYSGGRPLRDSHMTVVPLPAQGDAKGAK